MVAHQIREESAEYVANLTSSLSTPPDEVRFEKRIRFSALQQRAKARDVQGPEFLSVLGRDGYIVKGWSHLLAAYPKTGKTELMVAVIREWPDEEVLYMTEEPDGVWELRSQLLPDGALANVEMYFAMGEPVRDLLEAIKDSVATVVVIDSIRDVLHPKDENDNAVVADAMRPFVVMCRSLGKTLIFLHHTNKTGGEHGRSIAGAHAFLGTVDVAFELDQTNNENQRKLSGRGRILPFEDLIYERYEDGSFKALGSSKDVAAEEVKRVVLECLNDELSGRKELDGLVRIICEAHQTKVPSASSIGRALNDLAAAGMVERDPPMETGSKRGATYKWRALNLTSSG